MTEQRGRYWDVDECRWVTWSAPQPVAVPEQVTAVEADQEADVRSG